MSEHGSPILPALVKWAREQAGYSLDELPSEYKSWESGSVRPAYRELERMAKRFEIPVVVFYFPELPDEPDIGVEFRTLGEGGYHKLSPRLRRLVRFANCRRQDLHALYARIRAPKRLIIHDLNHAVREDPENLATAVREYLGITNSLQLKWASSGKSFEMWRLALWNVGVFVTILPFRQDNSDSFALYDPRFPLICVNRDAWQTRNGVLTMCHSLTHLLFHTCGVDYSDDSFMDSLDSDSYRIEDFCNRLSAEIVAPADHFRQKLVSLRQSDSLADITRNLANLIHVPEKWLARRLSELGLISDSKLSETLRVLGRRSDDVKIETPSKVGKALFELGEPFVTLAFESYDRGFTEEEETLAGYVELYPRELDELREALARIQR